MRISPFFDGRFETSGGASSHYGPRTLVPQPTNWSATVRTVSPALVLAALLLIAATACTGSPTLPAMPPPGPGVVTAEVVVSCPWMSCWVSLDGRVQSFVKPEVLTWEGVPDGVHTLRVVDAFFGGPLICYFFLDAGSNQAQVLEIVVENGQSAPVTVRSACE